jgi:PTS system nitrogen regulatory IIA component
MPRGGVSLLHALVDGLSEPRAIFARLKQPLDLGGGCTTDIVVLLASPAERTGDHLRALACLARRLRRPDVLAHVRAAKCRELMYVALTSNEWCAHEEDLPSPRRAGRGTGN